MRQCLDRHSCTLSLWHSQITTSTWPFWHTLRTAASSEKISGLQHEDLHRHTICRYSCCLHFWQPRRAGRTFTTLGITVVALKSNHYQSPARICHSLGSCLNPRMVVCRFFQQGACRYGGQYFAFIHSRSLPRFPSTNPECLANA